MNPDSDFDGKQARPHLLFHMATGSGKTLIMAGAMLYLYEQGYRNFLFFVNHTNIVEKTKDNFLNAGSSKYLFAQQIEVNGKRVEIRKVDNFQGTSPDCINLCLCTIQGLHADLNSEKENSVTYEDFTDQPVVLISDEAHHMNAWTKSGKKTQEEQQHIKNWEQTIANIFEKENGSLPNILLEFTATADFEDPVIKQKYVNKVIFDYRLKKFREDLYSKEVEVIESDLEPLDMALQAMILSQYKRKLFADIHQHIKPVVLLKSKTIDENKIIFNQFVQAVSSISESDIAKIRGRAKDDLAAAFDYFDKHNISAANLILELKLDFSFERLLLIDGKNISPEKQRLLNSLEDETNQVRAIFAVDMLNEGWDVLNLYDIVRLYNTRDPNTKEGKAGKTTMQEAQLIGRGARYMPFRDPVNPALDIDRRKYDNDAKNPLRVIEKLHYHSTVNPRYIQELHTALVTTGIEPDTKTQLDLFLKQEFKESRLYKKGLVFLNKRIPISEAEDDGTIGKEILQKKFSVSVHTGQMRSSQVFTEDGSSSNLATKSLPIRFKEIGYHVVRSALNTLPSYNLDRLMGLYPQLRSIKEFVTSDDYLSDLSIIVTGTKATLKEYSQTEKLFIAKSVLKDIEPILISRGKSFRGTKEFQPVQIKGTFRESITLNVTIPAGGMQEFGVSMKTPRNPQYTLDLSKVNWYAYNDNFGTSEEKALVKYIEVIMPKLEEKYDEIYLVRNEKDVKIYSFDTGQVFEPDFVLFLRIKGSGDKYDNLQLFIEPKGDGLLKQDKWKNDFLKQIKSMAEISWCTKTDNFFVWGVPFFNENNNKEFEDAINDEVLTYTPALAPGPIVSFIVIPASEVPTEKRYTQFIPLYSVRAACGSFEDTNTIPEEEAEGWVDVSEAGIKANKNMFLVHAVGESMKPRINDGDLCVFELYSADASGSREGEIVLTACINNDDDYGCSFTIKKYHSEKLQNEDGSWQHTKVELQSLNPEFSTIEVSPEDASSLRTIGILRAVL
jgi:type III restriction enzyme